MKRELWSVGIKKRNAEVYLMEVVKAEHWISDLSVVYGSQTECERIEIAASMGERWVVVLLASITKIDPDKLLTDATHIVENGRRMCEKTKTKHSQMKILRGSI